MSVARRWPNSRQVIAATDKHTTEELLEAVCSVRSLPLKLSSSTSTAALRVVRGDEKGTQEPGGLTWPPSSWRI
jgi:hypothetical protein